MIRRTAHTLLALALSTWTSLAGAEMRFNLQDQKTALGHAVYDLHNVVVLICLIIFIVVFGMMLYSIWKHRKSVGHQAAHFHENTTVEVLWTVIPFLILLGMAFPATKTLLAQRDTSSPDVTVKVTGYQWKWQYEYLDENISFFSMLSTPRSQIRNVDAKGENYLLEVDNEMVVPVGKKVRVLLTAGDVIHAWYVPALAVKQDSIPGFVRDTWFRAEEPGTYRGQCAELCGKEHAYMPIVVRVVSEDEYAAWVAEQKAKPGTQVAAIAPAPTTDAAPADAAPAAAPATEATAAPADNVADGKAVYDQACMMCHAAGIAGAPKFGDQAAWAPRVAKGLDVLYGHAIGGFNMMPPRGGNTALTDEQVKAAVDHMVAQSR